ncbi:unnamed protein product [Phyllotreta striolata]|uniref:Geranylgeranyl transferase type-1 subunit beta n=1 Tax=Phyllotreta striolata TaxID=444603 RepID=A0A9N9TYA3_PHYSR|nr:unnamed protein product [Phyllotreta striolata]
MEQLIKTFEPEFHKNYLLYVLNKKLPSSQNSMDTNRSVLMYFALSGLDILGEIENLPKERKRSIIKWIYSLQIVNKEELVSGFQGSPTLNTRTNKTGNTSYKWSHVANTYACLSSLLILGDDLSRVNKQAILESLETLQLPDGSFKGAKEGVENDMRFVYCAACICYILDDWSAINIERMIEFILNSISYDGGIGQGPELESHCGSTFCAIASLALSNNLDRLTKAQFVALRRWLLFRFDRGFNGRPNKPVDTCYSFWTGGALKILDSYDFIHDQFNAQFVLLTQDRYGGFSKWVNIVPDPMHTCLGLAGLSLMEFDGLEEMNYELMLTKRTFEHLRRVQEKMK